jgi:hypothetical protein
LFPAFGLQAFGLQAVCFPHALIIGGSLPTFNQGRVIPDHQKAKRNRYGYYNRSQCFHMPSQCVTIATPWS